ncbi:MAG: PCMD domain-containing protein [Bacteroidales bacterium]|nr:PCMD domain-containing protein [Bacteroidales bacterium]
MRKIAKYLLGLTGVLILGSCIENDLPYPVVKGVITELVVEGASEVELDEAASQVRIHLLESTDPRAVKVLSASFLNEGTSCEPQIVGTQDLTNPLKLTLSTYQDYVWTVIATQEIERWFRVQGQIGTTVIDAPNRRVIAYVSAKAELDDISVTALKLGPANVTSYSPEPSEMKDFTEGIKVQVSYRGRSEEWSLYVEKTELSVEINLIDPWSRRARIVASGTEGAASGFRYRAVGEEPWTESGEVSSEGGMFTAFLEGLLPETSYECKAYSGDEESEVYLFETEGEAQLPNGGFEAFSPAESKNFYSWFDPASSDPSLKSKWWDSGNVGSTTVGSSFSIAQPDTGNKKEGRASAQLVSRNVIIKFAAGNTFAGEFVKIVGTQGGVLNFGRPWTHRPRALRLWMKYECGAIDVLDGYPVEEPVKLGDPDRSSVWIALGDWDYRKYGGTSQSPVQINTTQKSTFFDRQGEAVIAYSEFFADSSSDKWAGKPQVLELDEDGWALVEIPLVYRDETRKPTHIIVSFAASKFGDYFTGSSKSCLWVDDVKLVY